MKCGWCEQEMMDEKTVSCTGNTVVKFPDGEEMESVPYDHDGPEDHRCHDCKVKKGGFHHPGCDMERCPACSGQLISCGCLDEDEDEDDNEE